MLKKNLVANYLGEGLTAFMGVAFIPVYIKYLGIEAYGLIGVFALLQACLNILNTGVSPTLSREMASFTAGKKSNQSIRNLIRSVEVVSLIICLNTVLFTSFFSKWLANSWLISEKLTYEEIRNSIVIMGFAISLRFIEVVYRSCIVGLQKQVFLNLIISITSTFRGLGAVFILIFVSASIEAYFIWQCLISILSTLALSHYTYLNLPRDNKKGSFSFYELKKIFRFAVSLMAISITGVILIQSDKILIVKLLGLSEFGYYNIAATVAGALVFISRPIFQAFYPKLCELVSNNQISQMTNKYHQGAQITSILIGSISMTLFFYSDFILYLWTQDSIIVEKSSLVLKILIIGYLLNNLMQMPYIAQLANGWTSLTFNVNIIAISILFPALIIFVPYFGIEGAAFIWLILNIGYVTIGVNFMYNKILKKERLNWYIFDNFFPLLGVVLITYAGNLLCLNNEFNDLTQIIIISIFFFLSLFISTLLSKDLIISLTKILKKFFKVYSF